MKEEVELLKSAMSDLRYEVKQLRKRRKVIVKTTNFILFCHNDLKQYDLAAHKTDNFTNQAISCDKTKVLYKHFAYS